MGGKLKDKVLILFQNRILQHILFWSVSYYYLIHFFSLTTTIELIDYLYTTIFHVTLMAGVYVNLLLLIPRVLGRKKYLLYGCLVIVLLAATAELNRFVFDHLIDYLFPGYFFISAYDFPQLIEFVFIYVCLTSLLKLSKGWFKLQESRSHLLLIEKEKVNAELLFLRSQINPHFLFNSLNNIYSLTLKKDAKAPEIVLKLSGMLRYMIYESNEPFVPLKKEVAYINNYIELQSLRIRDTSSITFTIEGEVGDQPVAPHLFIIFIENSFKHGIKASLENPYIQIVLKVTEGNLQFIVKNNKGKAEKAVMEGYSGIGLENVKRRLALLYPQQHQLVVEEDEGWYTVWLQLDFDVDGYPVKAGG